MKSANIVDSQLLNFAQPTVQCALVHQPAYTNFMTELFGVELIAIALLNPCATHCANFPLQKAKVMYLVTTSQHQGTTVMDHLMS